MLDVALVFLAGAAASYLPIRWSLERVFPSRSVPRVPQARRPAAAPPASIFDWALDRSDWVVLDLETTSLSDRAEPIEIAIVAADGTVLFDQLIMPRGNIKRSAQAVHGIDRKMLKGCPTWPDVMPTVTALISGRPVITYNVEFDRRVLTQASEKWDIAELSFDGHCAMLAYASHRAIPHHWRRGEFKWHKLIDACRHEGITGEQDHRALGDAQLAHALIVRVAMERRARDAGRRQGARHA